MPSPEMVAFEQNLERLRSHLIVTGKDYGAYTDSDHDMALGLRVLASAALEDAVERRCNALAIAGTTRISRGQPSRLGRALVLQNLLRQERAPIPLKESEFAPLPEQITGALESYTQRLKNSHGLTGQDFRRLVIPLGLREHEIPQALVDRLDSLGGLRGAAVHVRVNRRRTMEEPEVEYTLFTDLLADLRAVDDALEVALNSF